MVVSDGQTISTEQPESMHVHTGFVRKDEMGQAVLVTCPVAYHQHFTADGEWLSCDDAYKFRGNTTGRVLKNSGHQDQAAGLPINLPR